MQRYITSRYPGPLPATVLCTGLLVIALCLAAGYSWGQHSRMQEGLAVTAQLQATAHRHNFRLAAAHRKTEHELEALARHLGRLQAQTTRLEALGQRLVRYAGLEPGEFDFDQPPPLGGPHSDRAETVPAHPQLRTEIERLHRQLSDRAPQLEALESLLLYRNLRAEVMPAGRPVKRGWLSSRFGIRNDPFTGRRSRHWGVDYAGRAGDDIISAAAGVVTWAGRRNGYGNMVEINHGNGYVTRYGHAQALLLSAGSAVRKGQVIATIGNTGRSTGPHVHFEVLRHGKLIDPLPFIRAGL